ncbi:hypothetical protein AKO1_012443 [Acrasis kona]|uniref:Uncharacterized protein n=1 Tax=Acrasis kona TaxID=1008807 RepID=A0AAW2YZM6_9EUKA
MEDILSQYPVDPFIFSEEIDNSFELNIDDVNDAFQGLLVPEDLTVGDFQSILDTNPREATANDWTLTTENPDVNVGEDTLMRIKIRSRDEDDDYNIVPPEMFSSLSYTMHISLDRLSLVAPTHKPIVIAHLVAIDSDGIEVRTEDNQSAISGPQEHITLDLNEKESRLECRIPMKWVCVSWNHGKKSFQMRIEFLSFVEGQSHPLFTATSNSFMTLARRPRVSTRTNVKPKYVTDAQPMVTKKRKVRVIDQEPKKPKKKSKVAATDEKNEKVEKDHVVPMSQDLDKIMNTIAQLAQTKSKLSLVDRRHVNKAIRDILLSSDDDDVQEELLQVSLLHFSNLLKLR